MDCSGSASQGVKGETRIKVILTLLFNFTLVYKFRKTMHLTNGKVQSWIYSYCCICQCI